MKSALLLFSCAVALSLAACNSDKSAAVDAATTPSADTAVVADNDVVMLYREQGNRVATRVATDLGLSDTAQVGRVRRAYDTRATRLGEIDTRYATDTIGRAAALRDIDRETDTEIKTIVGDDARYRTYESNRAAYYTGQAYTADEAAKPATTQRRGSAVVSYDKQKDGDTKIEYADGRKVKVDKDGDRKTEYPNGTKVKRDSDDGERKVKD